MSVASVTHRHSVSYVPSSPAGPVGVEEPLCPAPAIALPPPVQSLRLATMARRLNLRADRLEPERAQRRNVTMIPARGARTIIARAPGVRTVTQGYSNNNGRSENESR
jgi:hypothetical protein